MKILLIDNYDSFTYNLVHYLEKSGPYEVVVIENDKITLEKISEFNKIVISPGPGLPSESGKLMEMIQSFKPHQSILGVCLGLQALTEHFGGKLSHLQKVVHGKATKIQIVENDPLFTHLPNEFLIGRYHSWVMDKNYIPDCLMVTAVDENKEVMAIQHKTLNIHAVQFHPESILTEYGEKIISNWLNLC